MLRRLQAGSQGLPNVDCITPANKGFRDTGCPDQVTGSDVMSEHEFYADPTVFDLWQDRTGGWLGARIAKLRPYVWSIAFSGLAVSLLGIALIVLGYSFYQRVGSGASLAWNHSMAQWLTALMALLSCHGLLEQALEAWPRDRVFPRQLQKLVRLCGFRVPADGDCLSVAGSALVKNSVGAATAREIRTFFVGARAAGVNVAIARALFAAGIRSVSQLRATDDAQLLQIHGVGPATVRRLRAHFN
jgi:hypothetical protein